MMAEQSGGGELMETSCRTRGVHGVEVTRAVGHEDSRAVRAGSGDAILEGGSKREGIREFKY